MNWNLFLFIGMFFLIFAGMFSYLAVAAIRAWRDYR